MKRNRGDEAEYTELERLPPDAEAKAEALGQLPLFTGPPVCRDLEDMATYPEPRLTSYIGKPRVVDHEYGVE
ncbi:MAG: hypothetical protein ABI119_05915 [Gemmatimonadaceae bacterium]